MKIGLTYDLRDHYLKEGYSEEETAEFDRESTIEALEEAVRANGHIPERIGNIKQLVAALNSGKKWDMVFNICEGLHGKYSREAQVPALLDAYNIPYTFSDPLIMALSLKKDLTKVVVKNAGFRTPDFYLINNVDEIACVKLKFPVFLKPVAEGTSKGVSENSKVNSQDELTAVATTLLKKYKQPVLAERFCTGREFTTGVLGTGKDAEYLGALEIILNESAEKNAYSYINKERCEELVEYRLLVDDKLNSKLGELSLGIWNLLECRDAGRLDFMMDEDGKLSFIEVNPLAGIHPTHSDLPILWSKLGRDYNDLIGRIIDSVMKRSEINETSRLKSVL